MRKEMVLRIALLVGVCFATGANASVLFQDDLDGPLGVDIVGTVPDVGGNAWTGSGIQSGGQILFAPGPGGGVQDVGPNDPLSNTSANSTLLAPFLLSSLAAGEVLHLQVTMANISATPSTNPFESTRVDLVTDTSGHIFLGEISFVAGEPHDWIANSIAGNRISSGITTMQTGLFVLDLYLDPNDAFGDGATLNAILTVNGGRPICGTIVGLSSATTVSEVRLVRNIDDEVLFRDLTLEMIPAPAGFGHCNNLPPDCSGAVAALKEIWPPNHKFVNISIEGATDPDGDPLVITATSVYQDEHVSKVTGDGAGATSPDARLSPLQVRAERNGNPKTPGNGRVYHIGFMADDGEGGSCTGTVLVCVPHDQRPGATCIDEGPLYNSLLP